MPTTDVLVNIDAKADKAIRETKKLEKELKKLKDGPDGAAKGFSKMNSEANRFTGNLTGIIGQMSLIGTAAKIMVDAWARSRQDAERLANIIKGRESGEKYLRQLSGSEQEYQANVRAAKYFGAQTGMTDQNEALATRAAMLSAGLTSQSDVRALAAYQQLGSARDISPSIATVRGAFGGNAEQIINQLITASGPSKFNSEQLATAASIAGEDLAAAGVSAPEFFSAITSNEAGKSAESIAERLKALANARLRVMGKGGFGGKDLGEFAQSLAGVDDAKLLGMLGSTEAVQGLRYWNNRNAQQTEAIAASGRAAGTSESVLMQRSKFGQGPEEQVRRFQATLDVMGEQAGQAELDREAKLLAYKIQLRQKMGGEGFFTSLGDIGGELASFMHEYLIPGEDISGEVYQANADKLVEQLGTGAAGGTQAGVPITGYPLTDYLMRNFLNLTHFNTPDPTRTPTLKQNSSESFGAN